MGGPRRLASLLLLVLLATALSGCWDRRELEEQAFVLTIGVDQGTRGRFLWTFQIAIPQQLAGSQTGGGGDGQKTSTTLSVEATTLYGALNVLNSFLDRKANLMHAKAVILSEDIARKDPFPLQSLDRYREIRRNLFVVIAEGKARDIIAAYQPVLTKNPAKFIETLVLNTSFTGLMPRTQLHDYLTHMETGAVEATAILVGKTGGLAQPKKTDPNVTAPYLPGEIPREGGIPLEVIGVAVFKGSKMIGKLNGTENRAMAMLAGGFKRGFLSFTDPLAPDRNIALDVRSGGPPVINVRMERNRPLITVDLSLEGDIVLTQSVIDYTRPEMMKQLESFAEQNIRKNILKVIKKTQGMGADIFGFGYKAKHLVKTYPQWENLHWSKLYPKAEIKVNVRLAIRRIGLQYKPSIPAY